MRAPNKKELTTILETVTNIENYAFSGCNNLTNVNIPNSVTTIGNYAFSGCNILTNITIPENVTTIGDNAFDGCDNLTSITIPENTTTIGNDIFSNCNNIEVVNVLCNLENWYILANLPNLKTINISDKVEKIGLESSSYNNLQEINVDKDNKFFASIDGVLYDKKLSKIIRCPKARTSIVTVPKSVTTIGETAFEGCSQVKHIDIDMSNVLEIEERAFSSCCGVKTINSPAANVGMYAFENCDSLTNVTVGGNVGERAFYGCHNLITATISGDIGDYSFYDCDALITTTISGNVGERAFIYCDSLTNVTVGGNVGESAFSGCSHIEYLNLLDGVETIERSAFQFCRNLTTVVLPKTVTQIADYAFNGSFFFGSYITTVTSLNPIPPTLGKYVFSRNENVPDTLYVPAGSLEAYKNAETWKDIPNIIELTPTGIDRTIADGQPTVTATGGGIAVSGTTGPVEIYTIGGALVTRANTNGGRMEIALPGHGVYIIKAGGKSVKVKR